jgi:WXG100 family type VII secretion target
MARLSTGSQELLTAGQDIVNTGDSIDGLLKSLNSIIDSIGAQWQGSAKDAFMTLNTRFDEDAKKLNQALKEIADQMTGGANLYIQQQEEQSQAMSSVANRLGGN